MMHKIYVRRDKKNLGETGAYRIVKKAARAALKTENVDEPCCISVLLTDDDGIHEINNEQRGIDSATDVLSFPMNEFEEGAPDFEYAERDENGGVFLGDMVLSLERARAQGEEFGHGYKRELMYLTVHSVLHLLGYDHVDEGEMKAQMRKREKAIMGDKEND